VVTVLCDMATQYGHLYLHTADFLMNIEVKMPLNKISTGILFSWKMPLNLNALWKHSMNIHICFLLEHEDKSAFWQSFNWCIIFAENMFNVESSVVAWCGYSHLWTPQFRLLILRRKCPMIIFWAVHNFRIKHEVLHTMFIMYLTLITFFHKNLGQSQFYQK
jgi:hypothetical protein